MCGTRAAQPWHSYLSLLRTHLRGDVFINVPLPLINGQTESWASLAPCLLIPPSSCNLSDLCQQETAKNLLEPSHPQNPAKSPLKKNSGIVPGPKLFPKPHEILEHGGDRHGPNITNHMKTNKNVPKHSTMPQNHTEIDHNVPKHTTRYQNVPK